jgi:hypothetical protein
MDKKDLKMYAAPKVELVDLELEAQLMAGSTGSNADNANMEEPSEEVDL